MINFISQQFTHLIVYIFNSNPGKLLTSFITRIALTVFCTLFVINFSLSWLPVLFTPKISHFFEYCKFSMLSYTLGIHHEHTEENISISRVVLDSAIIYVLFTIAYYGLLTPILFFNLISIACSLIHLKCNIDILLS